MKRIFYLIAVITLLAACRSSKDYLQRSDGDKALFDAVKKLNKSPGNADAARALPILYTDAQKRHLDKISSLSNRREIDRWQNMIWEYGVLQRMYEAITNSTAASKLVRPADYQNDIYNAEQSGAAAYYQQGIDYLALKSREDAQNAYRSFQYAIKLVPNYKDAKSKMDEAYQQTVVDVVINPITDNSFVFNSGWGNTGYNYSNEYFQQNLIRELGGNNANRYPARFYADWEARRENVTPDWVVNITLRNVNIPRPTANQSIRNVSKQIENGRDSADKTIYLTVYATVTTYEQSFTARAEMDVDIDEVATRRNIAYNSYREQYHWRDAHATFTGDRRALSNEDLNLINNRNYSTPPRREEVLSELFRKLYPQVKSRVANAVDW
jgi:tetratricopeptide (TPR) repeat protein